MAGRIYTRSGNYRKEFIAANPGDEYGRYKCVYCGKRIGRDWMQVDHIIPVHKAEHSLSTRLLMRLIGLADINDVSNLVPSCRRCNLRKGAKGGWWSIRGHLGRTAWFLPVYRAFRMALAVMVFLLIVYVLCKNPLLAEVLSHVSKGNAD